MTFEVMTMGLYEQALRDGIVPPPTPTEQLREDALVDLLAGRAHTLPDGTSMRLELTPLETSSTVSENGWTVTTHQALRLHVE